MTIITKPGIYDIPEDVYHADPAVTPSLSSSGAKTILNKTPYHFWYERENPRERTKAMNYGAAAHMALLEPKRFAQHYYVTPEGFSKHHTKKWAAEIEEFAVAEAAGKKELTFKENEAVKGVLAGMKRHEDILGQFFSAPTEQSAFWYDEVFKIWRRCRFDFFPRPGGRIFSDYKTASPRNGGGLDEQFLLRQIVDYGYHQQAAWYLDGVKALDLCDHPAGPAFLFIFQESTPPHDIRIVELPDSVIDMGRVKNAKAMDLFARGIETGEWPSYDREVVQLQMPQWMDDRFDRETSEGAYELSHRIQAPWWDERHVETNDNQKEEPAA